LRNIVAFIESGKTECDAIVSVSVRHDLLSGLQDVRDSKTRTILSEGTLVRLDFATSTAYKTANNIYRYAAAQRPVYQPH
jgi:hypothetical protein